MSKAPIIISAVLCLVILLSFSANQQAIERAEYAYCWQAQADNITVRPATEKDLQGLMLTSGSDYYIMEADITNGSSKDIKTDIFLDVKEEGEDNWAVHALRGEHTSAFPLMMLIPGGCTGHVVIPFEVWPDKIKSNRVYLCLDSQAETLSFESVELPDLNEQE